MKIINTHDLPDGKVSVDICMCQGSKTKCSPEERPRKVFKSKETLEKWKTSFKVKSEKVQK